MISKVRIPFGQQELVGLKRVEPLLMPTALDTTSAADAFRRRNAARHKTWYEFRGVPFTPSIVGGGWWTAPSPLADLPTDRYDATTFKRVEIQTTEGEGEAGNMAWRPDDGEGRGDFEFAEQGAREDPDCGLLDVYTPQPVEGAGLPVVVFFGGGGNTENPRILARWRGDGISPWCVYVSVSRPLSLQGYFTSPWDSGGQANHMHRVALAALEWVQMHIAKFGGDPARVVISGTSAGGHLVTSLIPQGGALFHGVIAHSGGGTGKHASRALAEQIGHDFWVNLIKDKRAWFNPTHTIAQIAEQDGIDAALRLGPSPEQMLAYMNNRVTWSLSGGALVRGSASAVNPWPVQDGDLIQSRTLVGEVMSDRWPTSVKYWGTWCENEASLVDDGKGVDGMSYLRRVGVAGAAADAAIAAFESLYRGRWQRPAYGHCIFGYAVDRMAREFTARGGTAYQTRVDYDSPGNGRRAMGHANQIAWFNGKAQWQLAQGLREESLRVYEEDWRLQSYLCRSVAAFAYEGDPNADLPPGLGLDLYDDPKAAYAEFEDWAPMGAERLTNVITNAGSPTRAAITTVKDFDKAIFDIFDANFAP